MRKKYTFKTYQKTHGASSLIYIYKIGSTEMMIKCAISKCRFFVLFVMRIYQKCLSTQNSCVSFVAAPKWSEARVVCVGRISKRDRLWRRASLSTFRSAVDIN